MRMRERLRLQIFEIAYLVLGLCLCLSLALRSGAFGLALTVGGFTLAYALVLLITRPGSIPRLSAAYVATWALYAGSSALVEQLGMSLQNDRLLRWDADLFGQPPSLGLQGVFSPWQIELLALSYMSYQLYLHWALIEGLFRDDAWRSRFCDWIFPSFALGFVGYLLFPAATPANAFPEKFAEPLPSGMLEHWNASLNQLLAAKYDAFPSLHVLITLMLLSYDWQERRMRFWIMLPPSVLMVVATLALRLHYAVDLLASVLLFGMLIGAHALFNRRKS